MPTQRAAASVAMRITFILLSWRCVLTPCGVRWLYAEGGKKVDRTGLKLQLNKSSAGACQLTAVSLTTSGRYWRGSEHKQPPVILRHLWRPDVLSRWLSTSQLRLTTC